MNLFFVRNAPSAMNALITADQLDLSLDVVLLIHSEIDGYQRWLSGFFDQQPTTQIEYLPRIDELSPRRYRTHGFRATQLDRLASVTRLLIRLGASRIILPRQDDTHEWLLYIAARRLDIKVDMTDEGMNQTKFSAQRTQLCPKHETFFGKVRRGAKASIKRALVPEMASMFSESALMNAERLVTTYPNQYSLANVREIVPVSTDQLNRTLPVPDDWNGQALFFSGPLAEDGYMSIEDNLSLLVSALQWLSSYYKCVPHVKFHPREAPGKAQALAQYVNYNTLPGQLAKLPGESFLVHRRVAIAAGFPSSTLAFASEVASLETICFLPSNFNEQRLFREAMCHFEKVFHQVRLQNVTVEQL